MTNFPPTFLWGASTAAHQIEGGNTNSDWWYRELTSAHMESSVDACDSYHRYPEDMQLLADAGLNSYRFSIEWARIVPAPGIVSKAQLAHYRRMIDTAKQLGLEPVVTLHHFTVPKWFADEGGWMSETASQRWSHYIETVIPILHDVNWIATMNEPNMLAMIQTWASLGAGAPTAGRKGLPTPDIKIGQRYVEMHEIARNILRKNLKAAVGWTVANQALTMASEAAREKFETERYAWEDLYLDAAKNDDFIGVQSYSSREVDENGILPIEDHPDNTQVGNAYRPDALGIAVRHAWERTEHTPILVTENGIATDDDARRIAYTEIALQNLESAMVDGVDVRGYLHWSAIDNFEWGTFHAQFGLIGFDRDTFERKPKPSLYWLGNLAKTVRPE